MPAQQAAHGPNPRKDDRYAACEMTSGKIAIYDRENAEAWIQSTFSVPVPSGGQS